MGAGSCRHQRRRGDDGEEEKDACAEPYKDETKEVPLQRFNPRAGRITGQELGGQGGANLGVIEQFA
jgi:hypothetical protein